MVQAKWGGTPAHMFTRSRPRAESSHRGRHTRILCHHLSFAICLRADRGVQKVKALAKVVLMASSAKSSSDSELGGGGGGGGTHQGRGVLQRGRAEAGSGERAVLRVLHAHSLRQSQPRAWTGQLPQHASPAVGCLPPAGPGSPARAALCSFTMHPRSSLPPRHVRGSCEARRRSTSADGRPTLD